MLLPAFFVTGSFLQTFSANLCALLAFPVTNLNGLFCAVCPLTCACLLPVPSVIFRRLTDSGWTCIFSFCLLDNGSCNQTCIGHTSCPNAVKARSQGLRGRGRQRNLDSSIHACILIRDFKAETLHCLNGFCSLLESCKISRQFDSTCWQCY